MHATERGHGAHHLLVTTDIYQSLVAFQYPKFPILKSILKYRQQLSFANFQHCTPDTKFHTVTVQYHYPHNPRTPYDKPTMKFIAQTILLCATLALATPAPLAGPAVPKTVPEFRQALTARAVAALPQLDVRASKPKVSTGGSNSNSSAAISVSPSGALMVGALGLGMLEIALWN